MTSYSYFSPQSIHMVVVDPGVGSQRRPILIQTEKYFFIAPDNGVLSYTLAREQPDSTRSNWIKVINNENICKALNFQYIQYRAIFNSDGKGKPRLDEIRIGYMK